MTDRINRRTTHTHWVDKKYIIFQNNSHGIWYNIMCILYRSGSEVYFCIWTHIICGRPPTSRNESVLIIIGAQSKPYNDMYVCIMHYARDQNRKSKFSDTWLHPLILIIDCTRYADTHNTNKMSILTIVYQCINV